MWLVSLSFNLFCFENGNFWKSDNERQTLSKMIVKADYFANLSWIALYDWMKICEWLLGSEYDVYHKMMYFLLYLDCEKLYVKQGEEVDIGECIYVDWLGCCWWIHICWLNCECCWWLHIWHVLVNAYMLNDWWWCGELFVWTYALSRVICSCIHDWWWRMFISKM